MKTLHFYFDFISPYAYFGFKGLKELAKNTRVELNLHPILFAGLLNHHKQLGPAEIPSKKNHTFQDCQRYSYFHNISFSPPPSHPFVPLLALRLSSRNLYNSTDEQLQIIDILFDEVWGKGKDISTVESLQQILETNGYNAEELLNKIKTEEIKEELKNSTKLAIEKNVFGVPTFLIDDRLFWGKDQLHYIEQYLAGVDPLAKLSKNELERLSTIKGSADRLERNRLKTPKL